MCREFAADALLRVAALDALDRPRRERLIEEGFRRSAEAQQPLRRRNAMPYIASNAAFQQRALAQDLDALWLRTRAVEEMLPLDASKARQMFLDLPPLDACFLRGWVGLRCFQLLPGIESGSCALIHRR